MVLLSTPEESWRESCWEKRMCKKFPTIRNRFAFAKACINRWNRQISLFPREMAININPNCLSVDRATTFFPSTSIKAAILAKIKVVAPTIKRIQHRYILICLNRTNNQTPAVTKVELCTRALTGVGAAIAAGSHLVKGIWALLVKVTSTNVRKIKIPPFW